MSVLAVSWFNELRDQVCRHIAPRLQMPCVWTRCLLWCLKPADNPAPRLPMPCVWTRLLLWSVEHRRHGNTTLMQQQRSVSEDIEGMKTLHWRSSNGVPLRTLKAWKHYTDAAATECHWGHRWHENTTLTQQQRSATEDVEGMKTLHWRSSSGVPLRTSKGWKHYTDTAATECH